jgi:hypothetical protein
MTRASRLAAVTPMVVAAASLALGACGEPTAQRVQPPDARISYELPIDYTDIELQEGEVGQAYGVEGSRLDALASDPVLILATLPSGETASFQSLRTLATGGEFDPLDESLDPLPNDTQVLGYVEYGEADVWGIRIRLAVGRGAADFQALVDRRSDQVVITELICTQACFLEQLDLIDEIQASWNLEP